MIYHSNLTAPDLRPHFHYLHSRPMGHSFGHDEISDWADKPEGDPVFGLYRKCGLWSHDEAAILYNVAQRRPGRWLDIGAHTGWTAAHLAAAGCFVTALEPMLPAPGWPERFDANTEAWRSQIARSSMRADEYFAAFPPRPLFNGVVVDGDHIHPHPLADALGASNRLMPGGVILMHDAMGGPVWNGIYALLSKGFHCHMYLTPHIVACCWLDQVGGAHAMDSREKPAQFFPPIHVPDPAIDWKEIQTNHMKEFAWDRVTYDAY